MSENKTIKMEILSFIKYKDECYEVGALLKELLNTLDEKDKEIERLNNKIQDLQADYGNKAQVERDLLKEENKRLNNIIKEAREYIENGTDFKSIYFKETDTEFWKIIMEDNLKNDLLKILKGDKND